MNGEEYEGDEGISYITEEKIEKGLERADEINKKLKEIDKETEKALRVTQKDLDKEITI